jgi:hypothetical protein
MDLQQNLDVEVEIETALGICIDIIDRPPAEYRLLGERVFKFICLQIGETRSSVVGPSFSM